MPIFRLVLMELPEPQALDELESKGDTIEDIPKQR